MGNPRQRRKTRSGTHKPVQHSRRAKTLLKKQPPIRGPKVIQDAWDPRKTVRQNYEALGLAASLNPVASGGTERTGSAGAGIEERAEGERGGETSSTGANGLRKGYGRIVRDGEGKIVAVELGEEDEEGEEMEEVGDPREDDQLAGWVELGSDRREGGRETGGAGTRVVQALGRLSEERGVRVGRHTSKGELAGLERLVCKYGADVEAMARDRELNASQRTAGELRRAIRKAGGAARREGDA